MSNRRPLLALVVGCLVFGGAIGIELSTGAPATTVPVAATVPNAPLPLPAVTPAAPAGPSGPTTDQELATALARPLFSVTRRPPEPDAKAEPTTSDLANARLTGIIIEPQRRQAVFALTGAKLLRLSEGDTLEGWRVDEIKPRQVSLSGPGGSKTLKPKSDPALVRVMPTAPHQAGGPRQPGAPAAPGAQPASRLVDTAPPPHPQGPQEVRPAFPPEPGRGAAPFAPPGGWPAGKPPR